MFAALLSKGFAFKIKHCHITERIKRSNIQIEGKSQSVINMVSVKAHLSRIKGFHKKIIFYILVSFRDSNKDEYCTLNQLINSSFRFLESRHTLSNKRSIAVLMNISTKIDMYEENTVRFQLSLNLISYMLSKLLRNRG